MLSLNFFSIFIVASWPWQAFGTLEMRCCGQHPWAKQLNGLFTSSCTTLSSMSAEIPNTAGVAPKSQRDCFSIKSGVTLVLCFTLSFVATLARAQCISRVVRECYRWILKKNLFVSASHISVWLTMLFCSGNGFWFQSCKWVKFWFMDWF